LVTKPTFLHAGEGEGGGAPMKRGRRWRSRGSQGWIWPPPPSSVASNPVKEKRGAVGGVEEG